VDVEKEKKGTVETTRSEIQRGKAAKRTALNYGSKIKAADSGTLYTSNEEDGVHIQQQRSNMNTRRYTDNGFIELV
jgi:hypothetical protein